MSDIPSRLQGVLWSVPINKLDLRTDRVYLIHQILMYGSFEDIRWLFDTYPKKEVEKVFLSHPQKVYTIEAFNYIKNFVLDLKTRKVSSDKYVNAVHQHA